MLTISINTSKESLNCVTETNQQNSIPDPACDCSKTICADTVELLVYLLVKGTKVQYTGDPAKPYLKKNRYFKGKHSKDCDEPLRNYLTAGELDCNFFLAPAVSASAFSSHTNTTLLISLIPG